MYQHFLITRFNLRNPRWTSSRSRHPALSDVWLEERFALFDNYCFPCVAAQSCKDFVWLVYFDTETPARWRQKIDSYQDICGNFQPVFVDGMSGFLPDIQTRIANTGQPYLITSRLDNDDCISRDYIEQIQQHFVPRDFLALDFVDGYMLEISPIRRLGRTINAYNPFISLIEHNHNPVSVWHKDHADWKREPRLRRIRQQRIWLTVIHHGNKTNVFRGFGRVDAAEVSRRFQLGPETAAQLWHSLLPVSRWWWKSVVNYLQTTANLAKRDLKKKLGFYRP